MLLITDGLPRGLGYYESDNRPAGQSHFEADTYTCRHCTTVVILNPVRKRERYKCHRCNHHICDDCAALAAAGRECVTFEQYVNQILEAEARQLPTSSIKAPWEKD